MSDECTIYRETIGTHEKELSFHASPYPNERPHTMAIFIDGYLDQYVSLSDNAIDAIIDKREAMRARVAEISNEPTQPETGFKTLPQILFYIWYSD